jgi:Zn-dependent M16 (insulinase) family peptidase
MHYPTFELIHKGHVPSLNLVAEEYMHRATHARHLHLRSSDTNNAFLVAFLTVPQDSTGVAHILEHTTLCGSHRYPVRDPFFMMIRRSLNTFMNALTASDWTAYPFATQNRKDFDNLLKVYLDAVFFPRLDPLDFAQEGHRLEYQNPTDCTSGLTYRGVVYNEMKGAMSAPTTQLWHSLQSRLFPTLTYHYNSGGDPEQIPALTYEQLKAFHARHYHPSNAIFMTYGDFPVEEHQAVIEEWALSRFQRLRVDFAVPDEQRYSRPVAVETTYPVHGDEDLTHKTHIVVGWLLGNSTDLDEVLAAHLLTGVLMDHSASPLRKALETTDLGTAPSELCGLDDSTRESVFVCGLEGSDPDKAEAVEQLILSVLEDVARQGVPTAQVEAVLHQLELSQREVGGGRFPYGLQLMMRVLPPWLHGGDPSAFLDIDPVLGQLRQRIQAPALIKDLARRLLLDNPHRVRLTMRPDKALGAQRFAAEQQRLNQIDAKLDAQDQARLIEQAAALKARQEIEDDPEVLPKVGIDDIPLQVPIPEGRIEAVADIPVTWFDAGTNGLVYQQLVVDLPQLESDMVDDLPLFCACLTEVGCGDRDYLEVQAWQAAVTGGISARTSIRADITDVQSVRAYFVVSGKALARNQQPLAELLHETYFRARFDEFPRLRELIAQLRAAQEARITDQGHVFAVTAATSGMGPCGSLAHRWEGLAGVKRLRMLDDALHDDSVLYALAKRFERIREALIARAPQLVVVSEASHQAAIRSALEPLLSKFNTDGNIRSQFTPQPANFAVRVGWSTTTRVNFCAKAYFTVPQGHPDAPPLTVLGPFLRNGFLHRAIREQGGAYGVGASYRSDAGAFVFSSYRDPRLSESLADFERALDWMDSSTHEPRLLEEAILGVISDIDHPSSPAGEALVSFFGTLHGRDPTQRRHFREAILQVSLDDLKRVTRHYLLPGSPSIAVVSNQETLDQHPALALERQRL